MNHDLLEITEPQAQILRAMAYYEDIMRTKKESKPFSKYTCQSKILPRKIQTPRTTFGENIKLLEKKQMVIALKEIKVGKRPPAKPYTITMIGQIAWLRKLNLEDNIEIINQLFPNIKLSAIDLVINEIDNFERKLIKDRFAIGILRIALDSYFLEDSIISNSKINLNVKERIELSGHTGSMNTSYIRHYNVIEPTLNRKLKTKGEKQTNNYNELDVSMIDRITFLFYYNLIQSVTNYLYLIDSGDILALDSKLYKIIEEPKMKEMKDVFKIPMNIIKKKKEIMKIINSDDTIMNIMKDNLKDLNQYKDMDFQKISELFIKP